MQLPRESLWTVSSARPLYWLGPPYNRCDTNVRDQPDASRGPTPVSYTHLDVYKRQEISTAATSRPSPRDGVAATYRVVPSTRVVTSWCSPRTAETLSRVHAVPMPAAQALEMFPVLVADPA